MNSLYYYPAYQYILAGWINSIVKIIQQPDYHKTKAEIYEENQLVLRTQEDLNFFAPIYEKYYDEIFIYINRRVSDEMKTAEITSNVFYKCLSKIKLYEDRGIPFSAWLYRIAINEMNQFFRKSKSYPRTVSIHENDLEDLLPEITQEYRGLDPTKVLPELFKHLNTNELQLIELRFFEKKPFKEIAFLTELTEINAKIKTYRILKKLRKFLSKTTYHGL